MSSSVLECIMSPLGLFSLPSIQTGVRLSTSEKYIVHAGTLCAPLKDGTGASRLPVQFNRRTVK